MLAGPPLDDALDLLRALNVSLGWTGAGGCSTTAPRPS